MPRARDTGVVVEPDRDRRFGWPPHHYDIGAVVGDHRTVGEEDPARQDDPYLETGVGRDDLAVLVSIAPSDVDEVPVTAGEPRVIAAPRMASAFMSRAPPVCRCGG